jgi:hypothetical protein
MCLKLRNGAAASATHTTHKLLYVKKAVLFGTRIVTVYVKTLCHAFVICIFQMFPYNSMVMRIYGAKYSKD